jgi:hypothetical protein
MKRKSPTIIAKRSKPTARRSKSTKEKILEKRILDLEEIIRGLEEKLKSNYQIFLSLKDLTTKVDGLYNMKEGPEKEMQWKQLRNSHG